MHPVHGREAAVRVGGRVELRRRVASVHEVATVGHEDACPQGHPVDEDHRLKHAHHFKLH